MHEIGHIKLLFNTVSKKRKLQLILIIILIIVTAFFEMATLGSVLPFLNSLINNDNNQLLDILLTFNIVIPDLINQNIQIFILIIFCFFILITNSLRILLIFFISRIAHMVGSEISSDLFKKIFYRNYIDIVTKNSSEIITNFSNRIDSLIGVIYGILTFISSIIIATFIITTLLIVNFYITCIAITIFSIIYLSIIKLSRKKQIDNSFRVHNNQIIIIKNINETFGGIRDLIIDDTRSYFQKKHDLIDKSLRSSQSNVSILLQAPRYILEAIGIITISIMSYIVANYFSSSINLVPIIGALAVASQRLLPLFQQLYTSYSQIRTNKHSIDSIFINLNYRISQKIKNEKKMNERFIKKFSNIEKIELIDVKYSYPRTKNYVLNNLSLVIKKGEKIGIIGESGVGKSTLLDVLLGLLQVNHGRYLINGYDTNKISINLVKKFISHVPQHIYIADLTIAENIAFGIESKNINLEKVYQAAQKAGIYETILKLPNKFNTFIGERGVKFSGGQRQRIGLARAFYKESSLIIMDEATSALDSKTEKNIIKTIDNLDDITVIMVSHKLNSMDFCNKIFQLKSGKLHLI